MIYNKDGEIICEGCREEQRFCYCDMEYIEWKKVKA